MKQRARRTKDIIDSSQHTQIKEVNKITQNESLMFFLFRLKNSHLVVNKHQKKLFELIDV